MRNPAIPTPSGTKPETVVTVLSAAPISEDMDVQAPPARDMPLTVAAPVIGDATSKGDPDKNDREPTVPTVYAEVLEDKVVNDGTGRTKLKAGKVVSSLQYDLKSLHRQGVKLKKVERAQLDDPFDTSFLQ